MSLGHAAKARHDLARAAEATLKTVVFDECTLERMKLAVLLKALDRRDHSPVVYCSEGQARHDPSAIEKDRTGAAGALVASLLCAGEVERFAQDVEGGFSGIDLELANLAV